MRNMVNVLQNLVKDTGQEVQHCRDAALQMVPRGLGWAAQMAIGWRLWGSQLVTDGGAEWFG